MNEQVALYKVILGQLYTRYFMAFRPYMPTKYIILNFSHFKRFKTSLIRFSIQLTVDPVILMTVVNGTPPLYLDDLQIHIENN